MNKQELQNQVSIIINGTRYDAVEASDKESPCCECAFIAYCNLHDTRFCVRRIRKGYCFKKSDKKFEV